MAINKDVRDKAEDLKAELWGSYLLFVQTFFPLVTGRPFVISNPMGRESHFITIAKELTKVARMETTSLLINVAPGSGKSVLLSMWVAWTLSRYPNSQYLYISYGHELASKHTEFIRRVVQNSHYKNLFGVEVRADSKAKDFFQTTAGGAIKAFGSAGSITGQDGGLPNCSHFSGAVICDDLIKPDESSSDCVRQRVLDNYKETILQRPRSPNVPIISIGQRLHEDDISSFMLSGNDERKWKPIVLQSIDIAGNALYPEVHPLVALLEKKDKSPYVFASQFQQNPIPAGGSLFKEEYFILLDEEPKIFTTFITADTAETNKSYNDATVFSFWGLYKIETLGMETGQIGLHWLDCVELRIEPKDLKDEFMSFYGDCLLHEVKPLVAAIEKKSTGVTLCSILQEMRGLQIREVKRTKESGSKTARFIEMQPILASKLVSFTLGAKHIRVCIDHMLKITANDSHRWDDICFVAGTKIATLLGYKPIEKITLEDLIITPFGLGRVTACGQTTVAPTVICHSLNGTSNHPIFNKDKFTPLDTLNDDVQLDILSLKGLIKWKYQKLLCLMESNITLWGREGIILAVQNQKKNEKGQKGFTWQFGNFIAAKQYQKAIVFTIKIITILITSLAIWNVFQASNILRVMLQRREGFLLLVKNWLIWRELENKPKNGTEAKKGVNGIVKMLKIVMIKSLKNVHLFVLFVRKNLFLENWENQLKHVVLNAIPPNIDATLETLQQTVQSVEMSSQQRKCIHNLKIERPVLLNAAETIKPVYNLTVDIHGVYYANDILVSNCDTAYDAIKLTLIDKDPTIVGLKTDGNRKRILDTMSKDFGTKIRAKGDSWRN